MESAFAFPPFIQFLVYRWQNRHVNYPQDSGLSDACLNPCNLRIYSQIGNRPVIQSLYDPANLKSYHNSCGIYVWSIEYILELKSVWCCKIANWFIYVLLWEGNC